MSTQSKYDRIDKLEQNISEAAARAITSGTTIIHYLTSTIRYPFSVKGDLDIISRALREFRKSIAALHKMAREREAIRNEIMKPVELPPFEQKELTDQAPVPLDAPDAFVPAADEEISA